MFAEACTLARQFTRPIVISQRRADGKCSASIGAFVVVNREGWAVTALHIIALAEQSVRLALAYQKAEQERVAIQQAPLDKRERRRRLRAISLGPRAVTNSSRPAPPASEGVGAS